MHPMPWTLGGTHPAYDCIREASVGAGGASGMVEANGAGLNCSGSKAFRTTANTALGCWSICSDGIHTAMRSNHISSRLLSRDPLEPSGFSSSLSVSGLFHSPSSCLRLVSPLQTSNDSASIINVCPMTGLSTDISVPYRVLEQTGEP